MTPDRPHKRDHRVPLTLAEMLDWTEVSPNGCRLWTRYRNRDGYGEIGHQQVSWKAHRLAWTLANGPIPEGMTVDHLCFNRACLNPVHMQLLPPRENSARSQRALSETCHRGHRYDDGNLRIERRPDGGTARRCLQCRRDALPVKVPQTHCKWGHELTPENTYRPPATPAKRVCIACVQRRHRERKERQRAA